jgi:hypothetical protein
LLAPPSRLERRSCSAPRTPQRPQVQGRTCGKALAKHLELLVRAALKSVFELRSLIASRSFSAPPNCNPHPSDRPLRLIFRQCSHSTILRGWPCQPRIPAGRSTPMPHRSLFYLHLPPLCSPPPLPPPLSLFNNKSLPSSSALPDLRRWQQVA